MRTARLKSRGGVVEVGSSRGRCLRQSGRRRPCLVLRGLMRIQHVAVEPPPRQPQSGLATDPRMQRFGRSLDDITRFCRQGKFQMRIERVQITCPPARTTRTACVVAARDARSFQPKRIRSSAVLCQAFCRSHVVGCRPVW